MYPKTHSSLSSKNPVSFSFLKNHTRKSEFCLPIKCTPKLTLPCSLKVLSSNKCSSQTKKFSRYPCFVSGGELKFTLHIPGLFWSNPGCFGAIPGCFGAIPGGVREFGAIPGCFEAIPNCFGTILLFWSNPKLFWSNLKLFWSNPGLF